MPFGTPEDRTAPPLHCRAESEFQRSRKFRSIAHHHRQLCDGFRNGHDVRLLKSALADFQLSLLLIGIHLPGDEHSGQRFKIRTRDACEQIGRTRAARGVGNARQPRDLRPAAGGHRAPLLMIADMCARRILAPVERLHQVRHHASGITEDIGDALFFQKANNIVRRFHVSALPPVTGSLPE